jgi:Domain of unknown function DUF302
VKMLKNILSIIGFISIGLVLVMLIKILPVIKQLDGFDPKAKEVYMQIFERVLQAQSGIEGLVIKTPVKEGVLAKDVDQSIRLIANELNIKNVGDLPLYKEVEAMSGVPYRFAKIYLLCNAMTAASMLDYNDTFASFLPCRVSLVESKEGKLWLYTQDMDVMIYGGKPLPPALKKEAIKVRDTILEIMRRAAEGDF